MRLFVAINFDRATTEKLYEGVCALRRQSLSISPSHKENLHLTLCFVGETKNLRGAVSAMDKVSSPCFSLDIRDYGEFSRSDGSICFAKAQGGKALTDLAASVRSAFCEQGFQIDTKPFRPHITLGRRFIPSPDFSRESIAKLLTIPALRVTEISLMKSERINGKLTYTEVYKKPLSNI